MLELAYTGDGVQRELERAFPQGDILVRDNQICLSGSEADVAPCAAAIEELRAMIAVGLPHTPDLAREPIRILRAGTGLTIASAAVAGESEQPVAVLSRSILSSRGRTIRPRTQGQASYVAAIERHTITFGIGPAGTGKTYLAMAQAVAALQ